MKAKTIIYFITLVLLSSCGTLGKPSRNLASHKVKTARLNYLLELLKSKGLLGVRYGKTMMDHETAFELIKKDEYFMGARCQNDLFMDIYHEATPDIPEEAKGIFESMIEEKEINTVESCLIHNGEAQGAFWVFLRNGQSFQVHRNM